MFESCRGHQNLDLIIEEIGKVVEWCNLDSTPVETGDEVRILTMKRWDRWFETVP